MTGKLLDIAGLPGTDPVVRSAAFANLYAIIALDEDKELSDPQNFEEKDGVNKMRDEKKPAMHDRIKKLIEELKTEYENTNRGIRIVEIAGGFRIITAADFAPFLKKLYKDRFADKLSKPALETLAIIAYKQPLTKMEIESLRNVNVDGVMKSLIERNLIRITGRKKAPGRPKVYGTTAQFMEYFGLKSLEDLPKMEDFSKIAVGKEMEIKNEPEEPAQSN